MSEFRYKAFISYNHQDERWAHWLHRALETYRIPRRLRGADFGQGVVPKRLHPVFRDRDELGSATDLSQQVKDALAASETLVVVCSPHAVASQWVNEEIREFRRLGRGHRIFAIIVGGDPQSAGDEACFPAALTTDENGSEVEPLAADGRKWADGRRLATLKLVAGILAIPLDGLRRRDLQRRQRKWIFSTIAMVALALVLAVAVTSKIAAEKRRSFAEELVGFKLNDIEGRLQLPLNFNILARLDGWSGTERDNAVALSRAAAIEAALDLRSGGLDQRRRGDADGALERFTDSWLMLAVHYEQKPEDRELLFELGQAEFWIGQVLIEQSQIQQAQQSMSLYAEISRRLLRATPEHSDAVLELAYALTNLGYLEMLREEVRPDQALSYMQAALEFNQIALVLDPGNSLYRFELEQSHANLADAQLALCDLGGALHSRMESENLAREFYMESPQDERVRRLLAQAIGGLARVQLATGLSDQSLSGLEESKALLEQLTAEFPDSIRYRLLPLYWHAQLLEVLAGTDRLDEALDQLTGLNEAWESLLAGDSWGDYRLRLRFADFLLIKADIQALGGDTNAAESTLRRYFEQSLQVIEKSPDTAIARTRLALGAYQFWSLTGSLPGHEVVIHLPSADSFETPPASCEDIELAARMAVMRGDLVAAESYTSYLLGKGYLDPTFIRFCRAKGTCEP